MPTLQTVLSWRDYGDLARRAAAGLSALGLGHQETIGLLLTNRPEFYVADAAALLLGAVPFSMYNTSAPEQLVHLISDAGCRIVVTETGLLPALTAALEQRPGAVEHVVVVDSPSWSELLASDQIDQAAAVGPDDLATLIYTSGTTGPPKGVQLTHENILTMTTEVARTPWGSAGLPRDLLSADGPHRRSPLHALPSDDRRLQRGLLPATRAK